MGSRCVNIEPSGCEQTPAMHCPPTTCTATQLACRVNYDNDGCWEKWECLDRTGSCPVFCPVPPCKSDEIRCHGGFDNDGCQEPDTCIPKVLNGCPNFCSGNCPPGTHHCPGELDENNCPTAGTCVDNNPQPGCENWCPTVCGPNEIYCEHEDGEAHVPPAEGCPAQGYCLPETKADGCPNFCKCSCGEGETACTGDTFKLPNTDPAVMCNRADYCLNTTQIKDECPAPTCPTPCGENEVRCDAPLMPGDDCPAQQICYPITAGCDPFCPKHCNPGQHYCPRTDSSNCPILGKCIDAVPGCDPICPMDCPDGEIVCENPSLSGCPNYDQYCYAPDPAPPEGCEAQCPTENCPTGKQFCQGATNPFGCQDPNFCLDIIDPEKYCDQSCPEACEITQKECPNTLINDQGCPAGGEVGFCQLREYEGCETVCDAQCGANEFACQAGFDANGCLLPEYCTKDFDEEGCPKCETLSCPEGTPCPAPDGLYFFNGIDCSAKVQFCSRNIHDDGAPASCQPVCLPYCPAGEKLCIEADSDNAGCNKAVCKSILEDCFI